MSELKELVKISSSLNVLYVEDEKEIAKIGILYLSKIFNKVSYAENGKVALEMYEKDKFDIILSDINMPKMSGLELASEIKKQNENQYIVFITAYSEVEILLASIKIGIDGYILKPINYTEMNKLLYKICTNIKNEYENNINIEQQRQLLNHIKEKNGLLKQYTDVIDKVAIVSRTDLSGKITYANELFSETSGFSNEELVGQSHSIVRHPDMNPSVFEDLWKTIQSGEVWEGTIKDKAKDGSSYFVHATIIPIFENDVLDSYVGIRFLSTDEELEKREFRKKVRTNIQEFKKSNYNLTKEVQELKSQLSLKTQQEKLNESKIKDLEKRLEHATFEVKHYESAFTSKEERKYDVLENYQKNYNDLNTKLKNVKKQLDSKKSEISNLHEDNKKKRDQVVRLNEEIIKQHDIIKDLRDTIKNIDEDKQEEEKPKSKSFLDKFK